MNIYTFHICITIHSVYIFTETIIGTHENAIRTVEFSLETNAIVTGSWDSTIKLWDPRASRCIGTYAQPDKVSAKNNYLISFLE